MAIHQSQKTKTDVTAPGVEFGVITENDPTDNGDSGSPWVDEDGYLIGFTVGEYHDPIWGGLDYEEKTCISAAGPALDELSATFSQDYDKCSPS